MSSAHARDEALSFSFDCDAAHQHNVCLRGTHCKLQLQRSGEGEFPSTARDSVMARDSVKIHQSCAVAGLLNQIADQFNHAKLRIVWVKHRRMAEQIEHRAMLDRPFDTEPDGPQEIVELPAGIAESAD